MDPVADHFNSCLAVNKRRDGNSSPVVAKGDLAIMLALIEMKLHNFDSKIDRLKPGRFRSNPRLIADMKRVLGNDAKVHVPVWGASHFRGDLRDDDKRGNKRHIIKLIDLLNEYKGRPPVLKKVYENAIRSHHEFWESFGLNVTVQSTDSFQTRLFELLALSSLGRVQQGIVYSVLRRRYGQRKRITTKKTFAGDQQSSMSGIDQRGDVQVWDGKSLVMAFEVKSAIVDDASWQRVRNTHGAHDYALFLLATSFRPQALQTQICGITNTFALHLADFLIAQVFSVAGDEKRAPTEVLKEVVNIFNSEFCKDIENDESIVIQFIVQ